MKTDDLIARIAERVSKLACGKCGEVLQVADLEMFSEIECPSCRTRQTVPARMNKFLLLETLGTGGMASVYRAYDQALGRMVAIKVMRREMGEDPKFVENFLREARSAAQLNHRNVVSIFAVDECRGQPFIVMELLDGGRLDELVARGQPIPERRVLEIARDVTEGLQAASRIGLVHGDIKPANILFDRSGVAKVADFGIARFQARKLSKGEIWGTPYYIAPEKVQGKTEDLRSDIYSLGGTLFHALCLLPPFDGPTATAVVRARIEKPPPDLSGLRSDLHRETVSLISRMLEQDPFRRYPTYASLLSDIQEAFQAVSQAPASSGSFKKGATRKVEPVPRSSRSKVIGIGAGVLLAGLAVAGWLWFRKPAPPPAPPPAPAPPPGTELRPAEPGAEQVEAPAPKPRPAADPHQPFSGDEQQRILEAMTLLSQNRGEDASARLRAAVPPQHPGRPWIEVFRALPPWFDGKEDAVRALLGGIDEAVYEPGPDGEPQPGLLARAAARILLGTAESLPDPEPDGEWPDWAEDLFGFFDALRRLGAVEDPGEVADAFEAHAQVSVPADLVWPYALRPVAREWARRLRETADQSRGIRARLQDSAQAEQVLAMLAARRRLEPGRIHPYLDRDVEAAQAARVLQREAERRAEAERQRRAGQERLQAELDQLDEIRANAHSFVQRNDFAGAAQAVREADPGFQREEAKQLLERTREGFLLMENLKGLLIRAIRAAPYREAARELGGPVIVATPTTLTIQIAGGVGQAERTWAQLSPPVLIRMAEHYIPRAPLPDSDKAEMFLAVALYAYTHGGFPVASEYAQRAIALDSGIDRRVRQFMPGFGSD